MSRSLRSLAAALALAGLVLAPATASLAGAARFERIEAENAPVVFDALFMRPLGLVGLGASAALWVPAQAITMAVRPMDWKKPIDLMLRKPFEFVFRDPLGSH